MGRASCGISGLHHFRHQSELFEGGGAGVYRTGGLYGGADAVRLRGILAAGTVLQAGEGAVGGPEEADWRRGADGGHAFGFRTRILLYLTLLRFADFRHQPARRDAFSRCFPEGADFVAQVIRGAHRHQRRDVHRSFFVEN